MTPSPAAPWHQASYETFTTSTLPDLLASRVPLHSYSVERVDDYHCRIKLSLKTPEGMIDLSFDDIPAPDRHGAFFLDGPIEQRGGYRVVIPVPDQFDLAAATIKCAGEQFAEYVDARLGEAPDDLGWDRKLAEAWLPISGWLDTFLRNEPTAQLIQSTNWIDRTTHLRRITLIPLAREDGSDRLMAPEDSAAVVPPGLACPIIMPEGPNMGWIIDIARGAEIRDGRLVRAVGADGTDPSLDLGWSGSMIPFIEHSDSARLLMGGNMMRQWIAPRNLNGLPSVGTAQTYHDDIVDALSDPPGPVPEPAIVRTGTEPDEPDYWAGYNLLTAFIMWDGDTFEDGIVLSESAASRMAFPRAVDIGDKMSNRHGLKGVVSRILPDDKMPTLPDGTPTDLIVSPTSIVSRMNFGQLREAVMGRVAHAEGKPAIVPAYKAPSEADLRQRLKKAGFNEDGMEQLSVDGNDLPRRSTVGYVYWGRLTHLSRDKMHGSIQFPKTQSFSEPQYGALKNLKAYATIGDFLDRAAEAGFGIPTLDNLSEKLAAAGITASRKGESITFGTAAVKGYTLSSPVPHPWHPEIELTAVPTGDDDAFNAVVAADERLKRLNGKAPDLLRSSAQDRLAQAVAAYVDSTLSLDDLLVDTRVPDSGRAVIAPGQELGIDEMGLPRDLAWQLFKKDVVTEVGQAAFDQRTEAAAAHLDAVASAAHLLIHKGVITAPTSMLALHPVLIEEPVIRIHPMHCSLLDADFDGDQVGVFRLGSEAAAKECAERLSVAGHLRHTPGAMKVLIHRPHGISWGLTWLARTGEGRKQIADISGLPISDQYYGKSAFTALLEQIFEREGMSDEGLARTFSTYASLARLGLDVCRETGVSINPFLGSKLSLPAVPSFDDPELLHIYKEELVAILNQETDPDDDDVGTFNTFRLTSTRGSDAQYALYFGAHGPTGGTPDQLTDVRHGYIEGLTVQETSALSARARAGISSALREMAGLGSSKTLPRGSYGVIARARRSDRPGAVFARAAARGESDPLQDVDARILCGLPVG